MQRVSRSLYPHSEQFAYLRKTFDRSQSEQILKDGSKILNIPFESDYSSNLNNNSQLGKRDDIFQALLHYYLSQNQYSKDYIFSTLQTLDTEIHENRFFQFSLFTPDSAPARDIIILLHGLNEKSWNKYLPWAKSLVTLTGKSVLLFPTAFHMDRTPAAWSDPRLMSKVARERQQLFPNTKEISFANAAMSHRLQFAPERFLLSGLQTFHDILNLIHRIRTGQYPEIPDDTGIDLFSYSIGAMLGQVLLMSDPDKVFSKTRLFMLAGGASLSLMNPVSKSIMDSNAFKAINNYYKNLFGSTNKKVNGVENPRKNDEYKYFKSLLHNEHMQSIRRNRFKQIGGRIMAVSLARDQVIPPDSISATGRNKSGKLLWKQKTLDAPFPYTHEDPFPVSGDTELVDAHFNKIMYLAADHLD